MCAMDLRFSLPDTTTDATVETRPADLKRWLTNLPVLNTAETSQSIIKALMALNRRPCLRFWVYR